MMATILRRTRNTVGNRKEEYIKFTSTATAEVIATRLGWVDYAEFTPVNAPIANPDPEANCWINSTTASIVEDDPGRVRVDAIENGATYILRVVGH